MMKPAVHRVRARVAHLLTIFALGVAGSTAACAGPTEEASAETEDELRALQKGDVDEVILEDVPAGEDAPAAFAGVASWSIHHVELRDPKDPTRPDPNEPFNGFFLIAKDKSGTPLFFDTMAMTQDAIVHLYFTFETDIAGQYVEVPLVAKPNDPADAARVAQSVAWLGSERNRLGEVLRAELSREGGGGIKPMGWDEWKNKVKCVAELAVMGLTISNPVTFFASQALLEAGFAIADKVNGESPLMGAVSAGVNGAVAGTAAVIKNRAGPVTKGVLKKAGIVGVVGVVGYQAITKGPVQGLKAVASMMIPDSCKAAYSEIFDKPKSAPRSFSSERSED